MDHRLFSRWGKPTVQRQEQDQRMGDRNRSMSVPPICPIEVQVNKSWQIISYNGDKSQMCVQGMARERVDKVI